MKNSGFLLLFFLLSISTSAQKNKTLEKADVYFKAYQYSKAIPLYEKLANEGNTRVYRKLAESYRKINDTENAEKYFALAVEEKNVLPNTILSYGQILMRNEKYKEAIFWFVKYQKLNPTDYSAKKFIEACTQAKDAELIDQPYKVYNLPFNSPYSDFSAVILDDNKVVFTSSRPDGLISKKDLWTNESYLSVFVSEMSLDSTNTEATKLKGVNTLLFNDGPACFDSSYSKIYFTRNNVTAGQGNRSRNEEVKLKIFEAHREGENNWGKIRELDFNGNEYSCAYPSISQVGKAIYFTSDRAGGYGGKDLYVSYYDEKKQKWERPENLGPKINTSGDERFPFIHPNGNLFFSSDGHVGFGGLDIFVTIKDELGRVIDVQNLGLPFNSSKDDFGIYINATNSRGFFSSDRPGGKGKDDIYFFTNAHSPLIITVLDATYNLPNVSIKVIDKTTSAIDSKGKTNNSGLFTSTIEVGKSYLIIAEKPGFKTLEYVFTSGMKVEDLEITLHMEKE